MPMIWSLTELKSEVGPFVYMTVPYKNEISGYLDLVRRKPKLSRA